MQGRADGGRRATRGWLHAGLLLGTLALATWLAHRWWPGADHEPPAASCLRPGPDMVWVPGGRVEMGDDVYPEEQPRRGVDVQGFWMDRTEVTNAQFAAFVQATGYVTEPERALDAARHPGVPADLRVPGAVVFVPPRQLSGLDPAQWWRFTAGAHWRQPGGPGTGIDGRGHYPVVAVTHADALAYARWKGHALPTEAQWEWAASGGPAGAAGAASGPSPRPAPRPTQANTWQGLFPVLDSGDDGFTGLAPVGCYAANALGLHDMTGNAWELTADRWSLPTQAGRLPSVPLAGLRGQTTPVQHVIKGGSFLCAPNYCRRYRAAARQPQDESLATSHLGFRTVRLAPGPTP